MEELERYKVKYQEGLSYIQVKKRIEQKLVNYDNQPKTKSIKQIILGNLFTYFNFLNIALGSAIIIVGLLDGEVLYALKNCLFMGVIVCNTVISIIQEIISKKTIDKLSVLAASKVVAIRDKKEVELSVEEIVLDDVLLLNIGNQVVTDSIILNGEVEVNEAFITGEFDPILRKKGDMILSGSFVVSGTCYAKVEHVGENNYISTISKEAKYIKKVNSVIMDSFEKLLKIISIIIIPIGILLYINQHYITKDIEEAIYSTVAALIGMIPEGLVLLTSSVLAVSVVKLSKFKVLVQQLYCIETLARVNVICLDKTGTITEGVMEVVDVIPYNKTPKENLSKILSEMSGALEDESATFNAIKEQYKETYDWEVEKIIPFSSARKFSGVEYKKHGTYYIGAPEFLLKDDVREIKDELEKYQKECRVLVLAFSKEEIEEHPRDLKIKGLVLIQDKIRKEAKDTLKFFKDEEVDIKIISGDNFLTVCNIAKKAGLEEVNGVDASNLTDEDIKSAVTKYNVFGRVTPLQKKKIIIALKECGYTVAMTGDGVNDVLALKESDCSIAMASGSEAARNVSQLVLLDSNFSSLPKVVAEGRRTINNIERSSSLLLSKTIFTILLIFICLFLSRKYFFIPIQLTLITMFTIGIPSFILALEPNHDLVSGNFLLKIVGKSIPAALTVVVNIIMIMLFDYGFNLSDATISTLVVSLTGITGFIFLYRLCTPFNLLRSALYITLLCGFFYGMIFQYKFFNIGVLNFQIILIFIVLMICSLYIFNKLNEWIGYLLDRYDEKNNKK